MNAHARRRQEREAVLLSRMELTRTQLLAATVRARIHDRTPKSSENALTLANIGRALMAQPNVTLLGSVVLGALVLGPKRVVPDVVRTVFSAWITRNIKKAIGR
ncbi:hypothetical protein M3I53_24590 [Paraburkholderia sp. CNPSo 3272]|uniref:hypothetical protein n=1 Tax=Paraburkholderia sp. CNPSo 3272 TaxID=2940931 RepID=UPI0020B87E47|nr:hypothetical protein [Paraburkholderia sp. CNPSo 3272]MCP3726269.1 hypothetical protein [Paraburkholderia sp. CNPSo 3272]